MRIAFVEDKGIAALVCYALVQRWNRKQSYANNYVNVVRLIISIELTDYHGDFTHYQPSTNAAKEVKHE